MERHIDGHNRIQTPPAYLGMRQSVLYNIEVLCSLLDGDGGDFGKRYGTNYMCLSIFMVQVVPLHRNDDVENRILRID